MRFFADALFQRKGAFRFWAIFLGAAFVLSGCNHSLKRADIVLMNGAEPESLDPHIVVGQLDQRVAGTLFEGLLQFDPHTGDPIPAIAESYKISPDALTYTFFLRSNALWSTGEPITAHDFVYSWHRALNPATAADYAGQLFYIRNAEPYYLGQTNPATGARFTENDVAVKALDDRTLRVKLVAPTAFFLDLCAFRTLMAVPKSAIEKYGDRWVRAPNVPFSGAYTLEYWRVNDRIRVRKNPFYWNAANVHAEVVDFLPHTQPTLCLNTFLMGDADVIFDKRRVPADLMDVLKDEPYTMRFNALASFFYRYNVTRKPFDDVRVRKALAMAVDKRRIVERITRAGEVVATHIVPPGLRGYESPHGIDYDPEGARKLLKEAGYEGGANFPLFRYLTPSNLQAVQTAVELREMWEKELGLHCEIQQLEWKVFLHEQSRVNFDVSYSSWIGDYKDPNTFLDMFMSNNGNNRTGWANTRYDELLREGNAQVDVAKRAGLLRDAETILVRNELPIVPLYFEKGCVLFDPTEIDGIYPNIVDEHPVSAMSRKRAPGGKRFISKPASAQASAR